MSEHRRVSLPVQLIPLAALFLAGCNSMDAAEIAKFQTKLRGGGDVGLTTGPRSIGLTMDSAVDDMIAAAVAKGVTTKDAAQYEVTRNYPRTSVEIQTKGPITATKKEVTKTGKEGEYEYPFAIEINPTGDGQYEVTVVTKECKGYTDVCAQPGVTHITGTADINAPVVSINKTYAPGENGLIISGKASDASGIAGVSVSTCNGTSLTPAKQEGNRFSAEMPFTIGSNCWSVKTSDTAGHITTSGPIEFTYDFSVSEAELSGAPEGLREKIKVHNNLSVPMTLRIQQCAEGGDQCVNAVPNTPLENDKPFSSPPFAPKKGINKVTTLITDKYGHAVSQGTTFDYKFEVAMGATIGQDGLIQVQMQPGSNLNLPSFDISLTSCNGGGEISQGKVKDHAIHTANDIPPHVGDNCLVAKAVDPFSNVATAETHVRYDFGLKGINQRVLSKDGKAAIFLYGNTEPSIETESITAQGSQPDWRNWGKSKIFGCTNLGRVMIDGQEYSYALRCDVPNDAGKPTISIDYKDKWGHTYSSTYGTTVQVLGALSEYPSPQDLGIFLTPYILASTLTLGASGYATRRAQRIISGKRIAQFAQDIFQGGVRKAESSLNDTHPQLLRDIAESFQRGGVPSALNSLGNKIFKITPAERATYARIVKIWEGAKHEDIGAALTSLNELSTRRDLQMAEIKEICLGGMLDIAIARLKKIEESRDINVLQLPENTRLIRSLGSTLNSINFTKNSDRNKVKAILMTIASFNMAAQADGLSGHDFIQRYRPLFNPHHKDIADRTAVDRLILLLIKWRNFEVANEVIKQVKDDPRRERYTNMFAQELRALRTRFINDLYYQSKEDLVSKGAQPCTFYREFLKGVKLPSEFRAELLVHIQIVYARLTGGYDGALVGYSILLNQFGYKNDEIHEGLAQTVAEVQKEMQTISYEHDRKRLTDGYMSRLLTYLLSIKKSGWFKDYATLDFWSLVDELQVVNVALRSPNEIVTQYGKSSAEIEPVLETLYVWGGYLEAQNMIRQLHPSIQAKAQEKYNTHLFQIRSTFAELLFSASNADLSGRQANQFLDTHVLHNRHFPVEIVSEFLVLMRFELALRGGDIDVLLIQLKELSSYPDAQVSKNAQAHFVNSFITPLYNQILQINTNKNAHNVMNPTIQKISDAVRTLRLHPLWMRAVSVEKQRIENSIDQLHALYLLSDKRVPESVLKTEFTVPLSTPTKVHELYTLCIEWNAFDQAQRFIQLVPDETLRGELINRFNEDINSRREVIKGVYMTGGKNGIAQVQSILGKCCFPEGVDREFTNIIEELRRFEEWKSNGYLGLPFTLFEETPQEVDTRIVPIIFDKRFSFDTARALVEQSLLIQKNPNELPFLLGIEPAFIKACVEADNVRPLIDTIWGTLVFLQTAISANNLPSSERLRIIVNSIASEIVKSTGAVTQFRKSFYKPPESPSGNKSKIITLKDISQMPLPDWETASDTEISRYIWMNIMFFLVTEGDSAHYIQNKYQPVIKQRYSRKGENKEQIDIVGEVQYEFNQI